MERPRRSPPQWAQAAPSGQVAEPLGGIAATGFAPGQLPPASWWNYQFNQVGQWLGYLAGPSLTTWSEHMLSDPADNAEFVHLGVDRETSDDDQARYHYVIATEDSTGPMVLVSRRGTEWVTRRNLGSAPGTPQGIICAHRWYVWTDTKLLSSARDVAGDEATCAIRTPAFDWIAEDITDSGVVNDMAASPVYLVGAGVTAIRNRTLTGAWLASVVIAGRQVGRAICWTGSGALAGDNVFVDLSSNAGDGVIHRCVGNPGVLGNWTHVQTIVDTGTATSWRLAVGRITNPTDGDVGAVVAYKRGEATPHVHVSKDDGVTWSAVTTTALGGVLRLAWHDGAWIATKLYAPYVLTSSDLETWTPVPVPVPEDTYAAVAHDATVAGGGWLIARRHSVLRGAPAIEPDTAPWTPGTQASVPGNAGWLRGGKISTTAPSNGQVLVWNASTSQWTPSTPAAGMSNPMTTEGDLIVGSTAGAPARLALGGASTLLSSDGVTLGYDAAPWTVTIAPASIVTTNATPTEVVAEGAPGVACGASYDLHIVASYRDLSACYSWRVQATISDDGASGVTLRDVVVTPSNPSAPVTIALSIVSAHVVVTGTGVAATTIDWAARGSVLVCPQGS